MKKFISFLCAIALTVTTIGCSVSSPTTSSSSPIPEVPTSSQAEPKELVAEPGAELMLMGGAHLVSVTESVLKDFMMQHPEIKITFEKYSRAEYPTKMKLQLSNGDSTPDILLVHDDVAPQLIKNNYLMDIGDIVDVQNTLPVLGNVTKDGVIHGVPNQVSSQYVFLYRKDIYDAEGLTVPKTFDEYYEQGLKLKDKGFYSGAMDPVKADAGMFKFYMSMLGGRLMDENGNVVLEKGVEALNLYKKCYDAGIWHKSGLGGSEEYWTA